MFSKNVCFSDINSSYSTTFMMSKLSPNPLQRQPRHSNQLFTTKTVMKVPCAWSSWTHFLARSNEAYKVDKNVIRTHFLARFCMLTSRTYLVCDIIDNDSCSSPSVIHWSQAVVSLLTSCIPYLKFYSCFIHSNCLWKEGSPYCRFLKHQTSWVTKSPQDAISNLWH